MRALKPDGICGRFRVGEEAAPEPQDRVRLPILRLPIGEPINMASKMPSVWRRAKTGVSNSVLPDDSIAKGLDYRLNRREDSEDVRWSIPSILRER